MNRLIPVAAVVLGLFVGGCESLAVLGGSAVSMFGAGVSESIEAKKAAIAKWKVLKDQNFAKRHDEMRQEANRLLDEEDTREEGMKMLLKIDEFLDDNQPLWLIQKFVRRNQNE